MKRILISFTLFVFFSFSNASELPFSKGINLTGWFQTSNINQVQFGEYTKQDFINIKSLGCDLIRLPINLHAMTSGAPDYTIDPLFLIFMDQIVSWAEELEIHLILDNHTLYDGATDPHIDDILIPVWTQMAGHFKNRSNYLYYEVLNEPHDIADLTWNNIQQDVVDAIRLVDQKHNIIIGGAGWNSYNNLDNMPVYVDTNLIYTFHFYEPFLFTHQGADWTDPSMAPLSGVPFPYNSNLMPALPTELIGTWVASAFNNYDNQGTIASMQQEIDIAIAFKNERNIPLYCGEFGVYNVNSDNDQRVNWYGEVSDYLTANGIGWTIWDYQGGFGLFEKGTNELFDYDLNIPLVEELGLVAPAQSDYTKLPDTTAFNIYIDFLEEGLREASQSEGIINYYNQDNPFSDDFCLYWTDANQYNNIGFNFRPIKDFSYLVENGYALDMMVRGDTDFASFDVRFVDTKTVETGDHPWRMNKTIDNSYGPWNGGWRNIRVPLSEFAEQGSWDGEWFPPEGNFDWTEIDYFQIVAENQALTGIQFWFDNIRIVTSSAPLSINNPEHIPAKFGLQQNYPNPFNPTTKINYQLSMNSNVKLIVFDVSGRPLKTLVHKNQSAGQHSIIFNSNNLASGVYYYQLIVKDHFVQTKKMVLLK